MILDLLVNGNPSHVAIAVSGGGPVVSYDRLRQQVDVFSTKLNQLGLVRGDRIAMALPNGLEMIVSFLAASTVGTAAPLNPAYRRDEFKFYLEDTGARALIVPPKNSDEARAAAGDHVLIIEADLDSDGQVRLSSDQNAGSGNSLTYPNPDDIALVLHTSGTTSRPKRVPLSHANLTASARTVSETYELSSDDVSLCVMPLFHVHGLVASTLATLSTGGTVVFVPRFNPLSFWSTAREHRVSWYSAVPTIHQLLLSRAKRTRTSGAGRLRFIRSCSAALSPQSMAEMESKFGVPVLEAYGMTE